MNEVLLVAAAKNMAELKLACEQDIKKRLIEFQNETGLRPAEIKIEWHYTGDVACAAEREHLTVAINISLH